MQGEISLCFFTVFISAIHIIEIHQYCVFLQLIVVDCWCYCFIEWYINCYCVLSRYDCVIWHYYALFWLLRGLSHFDLLYICGDLWSAPIISIDAPLVDVVFILIGDISQIWVIFRIRHQLFSVVHFSVIFNYKFATHSQNLVGLGTGLWCPALICHSRNHLIHSLFMSWKNIFIYMYIHVYIN